MCARLLMFVLVLVPKIHAQRVLYTQHLKETFVPLISDSSVLDLGEPRRDLRCNVKPIKPELGWDLRLHSGYLIMIPLAELAGQGDDLTIIFRVIADVQAADPVYFVQHVRVPPINEGAKGAASLHGFFDLGEGKYHVDWLMRNGSEQYCSTKWELSAIQPSKEKRINLSHAPGTIDHSQDPFHEEPRVERTQQQDLIAISILVNCASPTPGAAKPGFVDISRLVSIVRHIAQEPHVGRFSIIAFNMQQQQIIWRQNTVTTIDFPMFGQALDSPNLGTVDVKRLSQAGGESKFLESLIQRELDSGTDAVVLVGPRMEPSFPIPKHALKQPLEAECPIFYLNYDREMQIEPWQDPIASLVSYWHGQQFTIKSPRDLSFRWSQIISLVLKAKSLTATVDVPVH